MSWQINAVSSSTNTALWCHHHHLTSHMLSLEAIYRSIVKSAKLSIGGVKLARLFEGTPRLDFGSTHFFFVPRPDNHLIHSFYQHVFIQCPQHPTRSQLKTSPVRSSTQLAAHTHSRSHTHQHSQAQRRVLCGQFRHWAHRVVMWGI